MNGDASPPDPTIVRAIKLFQAGDMDAAADLCHSLLRSAPQEPALHQLAAAIALRSGDADSAARWAESALDLRPDHAATLMIAGHAARALADHTRALAFFQRAEVLAPSRAEAAFMTCATLLELGDGEARSMLDLCLQKFPEHSAGWRTIGLVLQKAGQNEAALAAFTRAARAAPSCELQMRRGALLRALGMVAEAADAFRAARSHEPDNFDATLQLALCLQHLGDVAAARVGLEAAVAKNPTEGRGWFALGLIAQENRDWPAAIAAYQKALSVQPHLPEAAVNLGIALQEIGDLAAARASYRQALELRADTFGRVAQALTAAPTGELWLDLMALRASLAA
jgi:tetratricopeptide (TPR) repeat protein